MGMRRKESTEIAEIFVEHMVHFAVNSFKKEKYSSLLALKQLNNYIAHVSRAQLCVMRKLNVPLLEYSIIFVGWRQPHSCIAYRP